MKKILIIVLSALIISIIIEIFVLVELVKTLPGHQIAVVCVSFSSLVFLFLLAIFFKEKIIDSIIDSNGEKTEIKAPIKNDET